MPARLEDKAPRVKIVVLEPNGRIRTPESESDDESPGAGEKVERLTVPENPLILVTVMMDVAEVPSWRVTVLG